MVKIYLKNFLKTVLSLQRFASCRS